MPRPSGTGVVVLARATDMLITQKPDPNTGDIAAIVQSVDPNNLGYSRVFREPPQESWNPKEGRCSYAIQWTYHQ